jgi:hypothetical protein
LKDFGVLQDNTESAVRLSPNYDLVTTTAYNPSDILALTIGGTKRWPKAKALMAFARTHCNITDGRARELLGEVAEGVLYAVNEATLYMHNNESFRDVGTVMLTEWNKGLNLSIQPEDQPETFAIPDYKAQDPHNSLVIAQRCPLEINPVAAMHDTIENGIGQRWIVQIGVPCFDGQLAGDQRRACAHPVIGMLFERTALSKNSEEVVRQELATLRDGRMTPDIVFRDPYPFIPRIPHLHIGIKPLGNGMRNQCLRLFFQEFNEAGFLGDQGIDPFGFSVESRSDQCLIAEAWYDCF